MNITLSPRSLDPLYVVSYHVKWVKTFWTYSIKNWLFSPAPMLLMQVILVQTGFRHETSWLRFLVNRNLKWILSRKVILMSVSDIFSFNKSFFFIFNNKYNLTLIIINFCSICSSLVFFTKKYAFYKAEKLLKQKIKWSMVIKNFMWT